MISYNEWYIYQCYGTDVLKKDKRKKKQTIFDTHIHTKGKKVIEIKCDIDSEAWIFLEARETADD